MILLEAQQLKCFIKDQSLFEIDHIQVNQGDCIGLIGPNGVGKTALLNILAQKRQPDKGSIKNESTCELIPQLKKTDSTKSGGEITQEYINQTLNKNPSLLLADEPTTNLDTDHIEWLEKALVNWQGAYIIASHDRQFLDAVCTKIWEINEGKLKEYKGNYTDYTKQKSLEKQQQITEYEIYLSKKRQLEEAIKHKEQKAARATKKPKQLSSSEAKIKGAKPYFAKKQKKLQQNAKAIETRLEKLKKVNKPQEEISIKMNIPNKDLIKNKTIIRADDLQIKMEGRILVNQCQFTVSGGDKIAIVGNNGVGKTTLIKQMIHNHSHIDISRSVKIGYFSQNLDILYNQQTILKNVMSTSKHDETLIRIILARLNFRGDDVYKQVQVLSGGERVKVALAKLFVSDVNTLILDEPTNFLDIKAVEALESLLKEYVGTLIFASHDRQFIQHVATRIFSIDKQELTVFDGRYDEFKHYVPQKKRDILEDKQLLLETRITEVLSLLSLDPTEALEKEFQELLAEKKKLENN